MKKARENEKPSISFLSIRGLTDASYFGQFLLWPAPGFHTTARGPKRAHLRVPEFKNTTKIQREDPQEREEIIKIVRGEGKKKREILGGPEEGAPEEGGRLGVGPTPNTQHPQQPQIIMKTTIIKNYH